ncbi:RxLR effector protein, partial [Phytophthora megakarya]
MHFLYLVSLAFVASIGLIVADTLKVLRSEFPKIEFQPTSSVGIQSSRILRSTNAEEKEVT